MLTDLYQCRDKKSWMGLGGTFVSTCYTHHQKTVVVDAALPDSDLRRLVAFVGGLDLTDGRFDTPEFPLFSSLQTLHKGDFYQVGGGRRASPYPCGVSSGLLQNCTPGATADCGPREPWHDIHARVEGPIVMDIVRNFADRWIKQNPAMCDDLLELEGQGDLLLEEPAEEVEGEGGPWVVQLLRSITIDSAVLDSERAAEINMFSKYGRLIDMSIQMQYVNLIRNAQSFIYIENQYFLGSAYSWMSDQEVLAHHVIPREITQKIIQKMEAGESFHCYVCIPMYPEGDPASVPSQEILRWQFRTIESMYAR